jgi:hypothetical protein
MDDLQVGDGFKPHPSHKMTEWESTVVTLIDTPRFGKLRRCEYCKAEEAESVSGHRAHLGLAEPCAARPKPVMPPDIMGSEIAKRFLVFAIIASDEAAGGLYDVADQADTEAVAKMKADALFKEEIESIGQKKYSGVYVFDCDKRSVIYRPGE